MEEFSVGGIYVGGIFYGEGWISWDHLKSNQIVNKKLVFSTESEE